MKPKLKTGSLIYDEDGYYALIIDIEKEVADSPHVFYKMMWFRTGAGPLKYEDYIFNYWGEDQLIQEWNVIQEPVI